MYKKLLLLLFIPLLFIKAQTEDQLYQLDEYIEKAREQWGVPGLAIAIVKDDEVIFAKGYGVKSIETNEPVDENSLFAVASNSKAFTTTALQMLVDEGKLDWDDKVIEYLPWFEAYNPYVTANMTIEDLVTHRSGYGTFSGDLLWFDTKLTREEVVKQMKYNEPDHGFREKYGYQNVMYIAAGLVIEKITGKTWDEVIRQRLLDPLNMKSTTTTIREFNDNTNLALPHQVINGKMEIIPYYNLDNCAPAAALNSSVMDMAQWIRVNLNKGVYEGETIFSARGHANLTSNHMVTGANSNYGLGWSLGEYNGMKTISHGGGMPGMISGTFFMPEKNFGFVIETNAITWVTNAIENYMLDLFFGDKDEVTDYSTMYHQRYEWFQKNRIEATDSTWNAKRIEGTKPSHELSAYTGIYVDDMLGDAEVSIKDGKLYLDILSTRSMKGTLEHWHYDVFVTRLENEFIPRVFVKFELNYHGEVEEIDMFSPNSMDFWFHEHEFEKENVNEY